jgi:hypothetical protein
MFPSLRVRSSFCIATRDVTDFILGILRNVKSHCNFLKQGNEMKDLNVGPKIFIYTVRENTFQ